MNRSIEEPNIFLWVLRGLTSAFLLGYLVFLYFTILIYDKFPSGTLVDDLLGAGLFLFFGLGYYLIWKRREVLAGLILIIWFAALWPVEIITGAEYFENSTAPGFIPFILGILFLVYRSGVRKRQKSAIPQKP